MQSEDEYRLDHDIISKSIEDILNLLSTNKPEFSNREAKEKISALAERIREATTDSYIEEKADEIKTRAVAIARRGLGFGERLTTLRLR